MTLFRNGKSISNYFDLLGTQENDMTAGLAYLLASSPCLLKGFVQEIVGTHSVQLQSPTIHIQTSRHQEGITDIELNGGPDFFAVLEAKRGPVLPSLKQLERYAPIVKRSNAKHQFLVTASNTSVEMARNHFPQMNVKGLPLIHLPWRAIRQIAMQATSGETNLTKHLLRDFIDYLGDLLGMEMKYSNMVYVVSLSKGSPDNWRLSWIDVVEKRNCYFYSAGANWPDPPNYMGFRYDGKLQSIRKVKSYQVVDDLRQVFPEAAKTDWGPMYVLKLGDPIVPPHEVRTGPRIVRSSRCWCMIDTLLTSPTISDALDETQRRIEKDQ